MQYDEPVMQRDLMESEGKRINRFPSDLSTRQKLMEEFDNCLWLTVIDRGIVRRDDVLVFCFYVGREIKG